VRNRRAEFIPQDKIENEPEVKKIELAQVLSSSPVGEKMKQQENIQ